MTTTRSTGRPDHGGGIGAWISVIVLMALLAATAVFAVILAGERPPRAFWGVVAFGMATVLAFAVVQGAGRPHREDALLLGAVVALLFAH